MKILALGDFHGKFPERLKKEAKKADLILCAGDFAGDLNITKLLFKYWKQGKIWHEEIGIKKARKLLKKDFNEGIKVLEQINNLNKKTIIIFGNGDYYRSWIFKGSKLKLNPGHYDDIIKRFKNIIYIHKKLIKINDLPIAGHGGYLDITEYLKRKTLKSIHSKKAHLKTLNRYKREEKEVLDLFKKNSNKLKDFIFLAHYPPYKVFDLIKNKESPLYNKHGGFEPYNQVIKKYQPLLYICGHMHEYQGIKKLGKTTIVTTGPAYEGKAALIDIEDKKIKSIKFLR